jgi:hypothetical protein
MESNAMLSWCGAFGGDSGVVGSDAGDLVTVLLLDDVGIVLGACAQTAFNEEVMQVDQSADRHARCAAYHARTDDRVEHPRRDQRHYACSQLDVDEPTRDALLAAAELDTTSVERMPSVVNLGFLPDMGGMAGRLQ